MRLGRIGAGLALLMLGSVAAGCGDGQPPPQALGEVAGPGCAGPDTGGRGDRLEPRLDSLLGVEADDGSPSDS